jgi:CubicO group peptidase (beta-lactamase class C family)
VDLDAPAVKYLPSLDDEFPEYRHVTLRQLATMTAGYDGALGDGWKFYASDRPKHLEHVLQYLQPGRPLFDPGTSWKYHDPQVHLLGYLLTKVSGKPLEETFRERIAEPIGMKHFAWFNLGTRDGVLFNNPAGTPGINQRGENQGGVCSDARDLARYGLLYLAGGKWDGKTLLDPRFVAQSGSNQVPKNFGPKGGGHYGLYWWTNGERLDGTQPWPQAPPDSYSARGAGRNAIFVIPEWNMVIVRLSPAPGGFDPRKNVPPSVWEEFFVRLAPAVLDPLENRE